MNTDTLFELGVNLSKGIRDEDADIARVLSHTDDPQKFGGRTYEDKLDGPRLTVQLDRVREYMFNIFPAWKSVYEISIALEQLYGDKFPTQSISARLRDLRKKKFGEYCVDKHRRTNGTWEYLVYRK